VGCRLASLNSRLSAKKAEAAGRCLCRVHAYVLMTNHVLPLVTPRDEDSLKRMMQSPGRRYVRHVNSLYRRSGTRWEGRYRAAPIDSEAYFLACCRYIELNPVRAGMVDHPRAYRWSSYRAHADGAADALRSEHAIQRALGARWRSAPQGVSCAVPLRARRRIRRGAAGGDQWRLGARRRALRAADRRGGRSPAISTPISALQRIEEGDPRVGMRIYAAVLHALGLLDGLGQLADPSRDRVGQALVDAELPAHIRLRRSPATRADD
jgi:REP element-mobilizing transposase RayT